MEPCRQEGVLGGIEATLEALGGTMTDIKKNQDKFLEVLQVIASQGTTLKKQETDIETLYARVRKVELNAVEHGVKIAGAAGFFSLVITLIATFLVKHWGSP
jgi:hypothetical protein